MDTPIAEWPQRQVSANFCQTGPFIGVVRPLVEDAAFRWNTTVPTVRRTQDFADAMA